MKTKRNIEGRKIRWKEGNWPGIYTTVRAGSERGGGKRARQEENGVAGSGIAKKKSSQKQVRDGWQKASGWQHPSRWYPSAGLLGGPPSPLFSLVAHAAAANVILRFQGHAVPVPPCPVQVPAPSLRCPLLPSFRGLFVVPPRPPDAPRGCS